MPRRPFPACGFTALRFCCLKSAEVVYRNNVCVKAFAGSRALLIYCFYNGIKTMRIYCHCRVLLYNFFLPKRHMRRFRCIQPAMLPRKLPRSSQNAGETNDDGAHSSIQRLIRPFLLGALFGQTVCSVEQLVDNADGQVDELGYCVRVRLKRLV